MSEPRASYPDAPTGGYDDGIFHSKAAGGGEAAGGAEAVAGMPQAGSQPSAQGAPGQTATDTTTREKSADAGDARAADAGQPLRNERGAGEDSAAPTPATAPDTADIAGLLPADFDLQNPPEHWSPDDVYNYARYIQSRQDQIAAQQQVDPKQQQMTYVGEMVMKHPDLAQELLQRLSGQPAPAPTQPQATAPEAAVLTAPAMPDPPTDPYDEQAQQAYRAGMQAYSRSLAEYNDALVEQRINAAITQRIEPLQQKVSAAAQTAEEQARQAHVAQARQRAVTEFMAETKQSRKVAEGAVDAFMRGDIAGAAIGNDYHKLNAAYQALFGEQKKQPSAEDIRRAQQVENAQQRAHNRLPNTTAVATSGAAARPVARDARGYDTDVYVRRT